jgi:D-alanyl-D-alanine carboxypeptidase
VTRSHRVRILRSLATAVALTAALAACTALEPRAESTTPAAPGPSGTEPAPAGASWTFGGVDDDAIRALFAETAKELGVPGAVLLLRSPEGEVTATYGVREFGGDDPVSLDDHIRVGSNTKTMTGTVILQLAQEGALSLDDPVSEYRTDVPNGENITIAQLLAMRAGLANYTETYELNSGLDEDPQREWDPEELLAMGTALPPDFAPGEEYHYSNTNTVLLGLIAEQLEGKPLEDILAERLFEPLGLDETTFPARDSHDIPEPYARGYMYTDNVFTIGSSKLPPDLRAQIADGTLQPNDQTEQNPSWAWAAGAVISTAGDLADWVDALVDGDVLDAEMQQTRMDSLGPTGDQADAPRYGYALAEMGPFLGHTGELPGYNSFMGREPEADVTLVVWANLAPTPEGIDPATQIAKTLIEELYTRG